MVKKKHNQEQKLRDGSPIIERDDKPFLETKSFLHANHVVYYKANLFR